MKSRAKWRIVLPFCLAHLAACAGGESFTPEPVPPPYPPLPAEVADALTHAPGELAFACSEGEGTRTCFADPLARQRRCPDVLKGAFPAPAPPSGPWWVVRAQDGPSGHAEQLATFDGSLLYEQTEWKPQAREPAFRADGRLVYVASDLGMGVLHELPDDRQLWREPLGIFEPSVGADRVVFASSRDGNAELYALNEDGLMRLTNDPGDDISPSLAPDGALAHVAMRGGASRLMLRLPGEREAKTLPQSGVSAFSWAPDGQRLALVVDAEGGKRGIVIVGRDGSERAKLSFDGHASAPAWSPDGLWLMVPVDGPKGPELHVARASGRLQARWPAGDGGWLPRWRALPEGHAGPPGTAPATPGSAVAPAAGPAAP